MVAGESRKGLAGPKHNRSHFLLVYAYSNNVQVCYPFPGFCFVQIDVTYGLICALKAVGLASNVKLPSEKQKARLRIQKEC